MRIRAFPFDDDVEDFLAEHELLLRGGAESRRAAALSVDSRNARPKDKLRSILIYGGFPLSAKTRAGRSQSSELRNEAPENVEELDAVYR